MGPITPKLLETMEIPWELFPNEAEAIGPSLDRATAHMDETGRPYALLMRKGTVASYALKEGGMVGRVRPSTVPRVEFCGAARERRASRQEALRRVIASTPDRSTVILASTGYCGRELYALEDRPNQLYMVGSMGCVVPFALGLALARPDLKVLALDGDGAALMRMGAFATVGAYAPRNFRHLLLDNGAHDSTGGQATVSPLVSFAGIAAASGYSSALETDELDVISDWLRLPDGDGPRFARLMIRTGTPSDLPRPSVGPVEVKQRLMRHLKSSMRAH
jgi:phosphonopyruvate decarboxylase